MITKPMLRIGTLVLAVLMLLLLIANQGPSAMAASGLNYTYTLDGDFDDGTLINVNYTDVADQLQLNSMSEPVNFIWIAVSTNGTVVKIDTKTGAVLGEFHTAPAGMGLNPSRTTVDNKGNVWVTNRDESGFVAANAVAPGVPPVARNMGSAVYIGLEEAGECVDRDGSGTIDTSSGLGDVKSWTNTGSADTLGGASTAEDECILNFVRVNSTGTRHVSVDTNNDVWIGGTGGRFFDLVDADTGSIIRQEPSVGYGGYGGLIDGSGVIWSSNRLLRWDTTLPLTGVNGGNWIGYSHDSYGLCIDSAGNVWNTSLYGNTIRKFSPAGALLGTYSHGNYNAQGCVIDQNDHVWVAHSLFNPNNTVGHLLNDGTFIGNVTLDPSNPAGPTGVAVDGDGKIWATGYLSGKAYRIDPALGPIGADGITPLGQLDFTSVYLGGNLYNYSDMTGSTLFAPPEQGSWTVIHDSGLVDAPWSFVGWNSSEPSDSSISVTAASSTDGVSFGPAVAVTNGSTPAVANGRYLKVVVSFQRATTSETPVLYDLTVSANRDPDCSNAYPSVTSLWPPNHNWIPVEILGVPDPDGDTVTITVDSIFQDEPVDTYGDGKFTPDGMGVGTATALVRAERSGTKKVPGDGRVYHITFTAADGKGGTCGGENFVLNVGVPHDVKDTPIDGGPLFDSTIP